MKCNRKKNKCLLSDNNYAGVNKYIDLEAQIAGKGFLKFIIIIVIIIIIININNIIYIIVIITIF